MYASLEEWELLLVMHICNIRPRLVKVMFCYDNSMEKHGDNDTHQKMV